MCDCCMTALPYTWVIATTKIYCSDMSDLPVAAICTASTATCKIIIIRFKLHMVDSEIMVRILTHNIIVCTDFENVLATVSFLFDKNPYCKFWTTY